MYILVRLLKGFPKPLYYKIPATKNENKLEGTVVNVPIKNYNVPALVLKTYAQKPSKITFKIREINNLEQFPKDNLFNSFITKISKFYFVKPLYFYQRIRSFLDKKIESLETKKDTNIVEETIKIQLTEEQETIVKKISKQLNEDKYQPTLLHGVTGSGKTEVYKKLIIETINNDKSVILNLPEVSLAMQFEILLRKQLPNSIKIIGFHSATKVSAKKELWQKLLNKEPMLIIGVHLPILLPIPNLGFIIIDEEHETGFQEKKHPKMNSKEVAIWRAQFYKIPILLGSATPSLNSLYNVKYKKWDFHKLTKRFSGQFPKIELVFLKEDKNKYKRYFWISGPLKRAIQDRLEKKEQILIYLNRRGFSFFVQCKSCGFIFECPNCSVSLTLHKNKEGFANKLRCHYCDYTKELSKTCPECKTKDDNLLKKGIGTQQAVNLLTEIFPNAKIKRADLDTTSKKREWAKTVEDFEDGKIDILVGTQVITKGYHFPKVTLVGVLWADLNLHFPIFNASETGLQKLIQVAGRAGRQSENSKVIVQAVNDHDIFNYLNEINYINFSNEELKTRKLTNYPPYARLIQIELKNINVIDLENDAKKLCLKIQSEAEKQKINITVLGPAKPVVYKIQKMESRDIFIKTSNFKNLHDIIDKIDLNKFESKIFITPTQ